MKFSIWFFYFKRIGSETGNKLRLYERFGSPFIIIFYLCLNSEFSFHREDFFDKYLFRSVPKCMSNLRCICIDQGDWQIAYKVACHVFYRQKSLQTHPEKRRNDIHKRHVRTSLFFLNSCLTSQVKSSWITMFQSYSSPC